MIEQRSYKDFTKGLQEKVKGLYPMSAQIELTYSCNLRCIHCYCLNSQGGNELDTAAWKDIIDRIHAAGAMWLTITGGEPLLRKDFLDIYMHAKKKGFLISIFTNGLLLDDAIIARFVECPPFSIEITLNGITKATYENISQVEDSFEPLIRNVDKVIAAKLPLVLKAIGLKENKHEIHEIKAYVTERLGKGKFKFDSFIVPGLDGDKTPLLHRLSIDEIVEIEERDPDMQVQREEEFAKHKPHCRGPEYKYNCNSWFNQFYITPSGMLRFCHISDKYSTDLTKTSFEDGFYGVFPSILEERRDSISKCAVCELKEFCHHCPARAYLETGSEDEVVPYYCELAKMKKARTEKFKAVSTG